MAGGFTSSSEKQVLQNRLWIPAIKKLYESNERKPLRVLCLPGRECKFLRVLLDKSYVTLDTVTCIEKDPGESLLIRGRLSHYAKGSGPFNAKIINERLLDYLTVEREAAIREKYQVIDLDLYGRLEDERSDLLTSLAAAIELQTRANIDDWLLLLTAEVASARGGGARAKLAQAATRMLDAYSGECATVATTVNGDTSPWADVVRYAAGAIACTVTAAFPMYRAVLTGDPGFYRGQNEWEQLGALMMGLPVRMRRFDRPVAGLGSNRDIARTESITENLRRASTSFAICRNEKGGLEVTRDAARFAQLFAQS